MSEFVQLEVTRKIKQLEVEGARAPVFKVTLMVVTQSWKPR